MINNNHHDECNNDDDGDVNCKGRSSRLKKHGLKVRCFGLKRRSRILRHFKATVWELGSTGLNVDFRVSFTGGSRLIRTKQ